MNAAPRPAHPGDGQRRAEVLTAHQAEAPRRGAAQGHRVRHSGVGAPCPALRSAPARRRRIHLKRLRGPEAGPAVGRAGGAVPGCGAGGCGAGWGPAGSGEAGERVPSGEVGTRPRVGRPCGVPVLCYKAGGTPIGERSSLSPPGKESGVGAPSFRRHPASLGKHQTSPGVCRRSVWFRFDFGGVWMIDVVKAKLNKVTETNRGHSQCKFLLLPQECEADAVIFW